MVHHLRVLLSIFSLCEKYSLYYCNSKIPKTEVVTKSELTRIIFHAFFKSQKDKDFEKVRELAIKMRKGLLWVVSEKM